MGIFPHDHARSVPIAGEKMALLEFLITISDFVLRSPFGMVKIQFSKKDCLVLTGPEGNHGEDVKEYYFYLDNTPTHAYMKYLYKYPQATFPYAQLVQENQQRGYTEPEFELLDTGILMATATLTCLSNMLKNHPKIL
jgi:hypothetical protein